MSEPFLSSQPKFHLGNYKLNLNLSSLYSPSLKPIYPPVNLQRDLIRAAENKQAENDGKIRLAPGIDIPESSLMSLATFLSKYAHNAPKPPIDGWTLSTDSINLVTEKTGLQPYMRLIGIKDQLPSGFALIYNKDKQMVGFLVEGTW